MSYFRPNIEKLKGYVPGEQPQEGGFIKLNTNENPYPPSERVLDAIRSAVTGRLRLYPDPVATLFRETAARMLNVPPSWIVATNGSDDALTILTRACLGPDDLLVAPVPSYGLYRTLADIQGCRFEERDWAGDGELPANFCDDAKVAMVANPNSPTGTMVQPRSLLALAQSARGLMICDEAYVDFTNESCVTLINECERLVVTRTFSKSYSLAGIRFGFIVAQPAITSVLLNVKDSYNCDAVSIAAAIAALEDRESFGEHCRKIHATRRRLELSLAELGFTVTPSHANFVWVRHQAPLEPIYRALKERKVLIRYFSYLRHGEGLRITVGTDEEINVLLDELRAIV